MNIDNLTFGQLKEIAGLFKIFKKSSSDKEEHFMIGKDVIIRTYSAGCWYGRLYKKDGNEVILSNARRMWRWWAKESISLSACAKFGINQAKSKIVAPVDHVWLEAIEIIPCTDGAAKSIEEAPHVEAE